MSETSDASAHARRTWDERAGLAGFRPVLDPGDLAGAKNDHLTRLHGYHIRRHIEGQRGLALELGCGVGRLLPLLEGQGRIVFGVDFSLPMIIAGRMRAPGTRALAASIQALPLPDRSVDTVLSVLVLQHVLTAGELDEVMTEAGRVAVQGARWILIEQVAMSAERRVREGSDFHVRRDPIEYGEAFARTGWKLRHASPVRAHPCLALRHSSAMSVFGRISDGLAATLETANAHLRRGRSAYEEWCLVGIRQ